MALAFKPGLRLCAATLAVAAGLLEAGATRASAAGEVAVAWGNITPFAGAVQPKWGNITPFWGNITPFSGDVAETWGNITPFSGDVAETWGNITPFSGNITPFAGNAAPSWGNITPFWGNITPFGGSMNASWGNITPFAGDVQASWGNITPFWGNITPLWGNITPFAGDVSAAWGNITPFWGNITPFSGSVQASWGNITPFGGNITPFSGGVQASWGNITPFWGNITPFAGNASPSWGNITPFWGNITPFAGEIAASWGNITPFWGNITPFGGEVAASWGNITPFWGNITPFAGGAAPSWGNITPFWGNITPFAGDVAAKWGNITPFWGNITPFWGNITPFSGNLAASWGNITPFWGNITPFWGNITPFIDQASYVAAGQQVAGLLAVQDQLLNYYRVERPDHWMSPVGWSPMLAFAAGGGQVTVGLLDSAVATDSSALYVSQYVGGYADGGGSGHGAAVASLLGARLDGYGTVGAAPGAALVAYNPFDQTGTTNFGDVADGVAALGRAGASVVNMSMGVTGETLPAEWNGVFSNPAVAAVSGSTVYVIAAGNDGTTQARDIGWNAAVDPTILVVGSVGLDGNISDFSNRPGGASLTDEAGASLGALKDRFIVAPGEALLVDNGDGSISRRSGTSLATPLVSGAVALLQSRWPWLARHPKAAAAVILGSARDMGAPGVDEVYGVGLLDVAASQRPLDVDALLTFAADGKGGIVERRADLVRPSVLGATPRWGATGAVTYVYERVGGTIRDFAIPLESRLIGRTTLAAGRRFDQFQSYMASRAASFMPARSLASGNDRHFASFAGYGAPMAGMEGVTATFYAAPRTRLVGYRQSRLPYQTALRFGLADERVVFNMGYGDGAVALGNRAGFGMISDYDVTAGGANPFLGLASGGAYASASATLAPGLTASLGATQRELARDLRGVTLTEQLAFGGVDDYRAAAQTLGVGYQATRWLNVSASYTRLRERSSMLGVQSFDAADFQSGSTSRALTLGAEMDFGSGFNLAASGTWGRTSAGADGVQGFRVTGGGLKTTAFQVALTKDHVLDRTDRLRVSVAQPMHVEGGTIGYNGLQVVDRQTGELGLIGQRFGVTSAKRPYVAEALYARALPDDIGEVSLFGRANLRPGVDPQTSLSLGAAYIAGARVKFGF